MNDKIVFLVKTIALIIAVLAFGTGVYMSYLVNDINKTSKDEKEAVKTFGEYLSIPFYIFLGIMLIYSVYLIYKKYKDKDNKFDVIEEIKPFLFIILSVFAITFVLAVVGWNISSIYDDNTMRYETPEEKNIADETKNDKFANISQIMTTLTAVAIPLIIFLG